MDILIIVLIVIAIIVMIIFNRFVRLRHKVKQSKSSIDVYLTQRFDLIPNLVECVKGYAKHEEKVFSKIAEMRSDYLKDSDKDLKKGSLLNSEFNRLFAIGESYPELRSNEQFQELQRSLIKMESQLQAARRLYNGDVTLYNTTINTFPNSIFAMLFNFKEYDLFEIEEYKKDNIKVDL